METPKENITLITDDSVLCELRPRAKQRHKELYYEQAGPMLTGVAWRLDVNMWHDSTAMSLDDNVEAFYRAYNAIHAMNGLHELQLKPTGAASDLRVDYASNNINVSYDGHASIPEILAPYLGSIAVREPGAEEESVHIGVLGDNYYAETMSIWRADLDEFWQYTGPRYYRFGAIVYRIAGRQLLLSEENEE